MADNQLSFEDMELEKFQKHSEFVYGELDKRKKEIAYCIGRKELVTLSGLAYPTIAEILNTSGGQRPWPPALDPILILKKPDKYTEVITNFICDLTDRVHPEKKATKPPEQELKDLKKAIKAKGLDVLFQDHF